MPTPAPGELSCWRPTSSLGEADVLVLDVGEAEGAEVGELRVGRDEVRTLVQGQRVDLLPEGAVDLVGDVPGLGGVELLRRVLEQLVDLRAADPGVVLLDVL